MYWIPLGATKSLISYRSSMVIGNHRARRSESHAMAHGISLHARASASKYLATARSTGGIYGGYEKPWERGRNSVKINGVTFNATNIPTARALVSRKRKRMRSSSK